MKINYLVVANRRYLHDEYVRKHTKNCTKIFGFKSLFFTNSNATFADTALLHYNSTPWCLAAYHQVGTVLKSIVSINTINAFQFQHKMKLFLFHNGLKQVKANNLSVDQKNLIRDYLIETHATCTKFANLSGTRNA